MNTPELKYDYSCQVFDYLNGEWIGAKYRGQIVARGTCVVMTADWNQWEVIPEFVRPVPGLPKDYHQ